MDKMLITTFNTEAQAYLGLEALESLHHEGEITLYATAIITKDFDGEVTVIQEADKGPVGTSLGMLTGALLGLAGGAAGAAIGVAASTGLGASMGALGGMAYDVTELGINADFLDEVSDLLLPGKTAVLAEIGEGSELAVDTEMTLLGGSVYRMPRDDVIENQLVDESIALNDELDELEEKAKTSKAETKASIKKTKDSIKARLRAIVDQANKKIDEINKETDAKVKKLQAQLKTAKAEQKAKIEKRITKLQAAQKARTQKLKKASTIAKEALTPNKKEK